MGEIILLGIIGVCLGVIIDDIKAIRKLMEEKD